MSTQEKAIELLKRQKRELEDKASLVYLLIQGRNPENIEKEAGLEVLTDIANIMLKNREFIGAYQLYKELFNTLDPELEKFYRRLLTKTEEYESKMNALHEKAYKQDS